MGILDGVNFGKKSEGRSSNLTAKGRIESAIEQQQKIANGTLEYNGNPNLAPKSWWNNGRMTMKVSSYTLLRYDCSESEYKKLLEMMLDNLNNGKAKDMEDDLQSRLDKAKEKKG